jgi:hypothetical protein
MNGSNKFLFGIVIGIVLLVIVSFSVVMLRPEPEYQPADTPEGVAHNYLLALQKQDYERAYEMLPTTFNFPRDAVTMGEDVADNTWHFQTGGDVSLAVDDVQMLDADTAVVTIRKTTFYSQGIMGSDQYTETFKVTLEKENGVWKVREANDYWYDCWGVTRPSWCR